MQGAPAYKVGLGYASGLPGPLGWGAFGADVLDSGISAIPDNVDIDATKKGLEKYGFDEGFELGTPSADGSIPVVRSDAGKAEDFLKTQKDAWLAKTANSPAARSGSFTDEQRWQTMLDHQQWKRDNNRSFDYGEFLNDRVRGGWRSTGIPELGGDIR
jgi:hypothetical protein